MNKIQQALEYKPYIGDKTDNEGNRICYEKAWFCNTDKIIHQNEKSYFRCNHCISEIDKLEYEALKRLEFLIDGYFIHCLGEFYSKLSTERICELYNVKMKYFKPWL